jgi:hypothetical protein
MKPFQAVKDLVYLAALPEFPRLQSTLASRNVIAFEWSHGIGYPGVLPDSADCA